METKYGSKIFTVTFFLVKSSMIFSEGAICTSRTFGLYDTPYNAIVELSNDLDDSENASESNLTT